MFERNGGEVVARIEETTVAGQNALETRLSARAAASQVAHSHPPLVHSSPFPSPLFPLLTPSGGHLADITPSAHHATMISFDWLTSDHRETHTSECAPPQPRSLAWQPSPSPLRHVSSTLQYHPLSTPSPPLPLSPAVWSNLPIELVTQILLYAAFASRADAHAFCLVSSAVRRAVLPALYHNVLLRSASQVPAFVSPFTAKQRRPPYHYYPSPSGHDNSSSSSNSKLLAHIPIHALALALPTKRPSLEVALARTAPALTSLEHLALTAPLLGAHAHWLRAAPHVRPRTLTLYHLGRPAPVHFGEPFLRNVTHLYTSTLCGFRGTSPASLPSLTHVALSTRATQPPSVIDDVLAAARRVLSTCPHLVMLVLSLDSTGSTPTPTAIAASAAAAAAAATPASCAHGGIGIATPSIITLPVPWRAALARQRDPRLHVLPFALHARIMWWDVVAGGEGSGVQDVFACAQAWRDAEARGVTSVMLRLAAEAALRNAALDSWKEDEWDLDLMTAPGYVHGRSADEGETDTRF
ncbi:hypothetical protein BGY98DRAFT_541153 [Russula aff. rugulosa BPL654]|nr:hypothetical protein BGY98DRAFT_541153 [Russula aff. rugulosa BPL654]